MVPIKSKKLKMASNNPQQQLVWFFLLDSSTGMPYKGTSADAVSLPPRSVIVHFRDAVHLKNSSILTGIASSQLLVYMTKAAFDKRNAAVDEEKVEPLKSSLSLDGLGTTEEEALVVVVPSSTPATHNPTDLFLPCQISFYNDICKAVEINGWLSFLEVIPSSLNRLYIRDSYKTIESSIKPGINKSIITGSPGIGKSLFMIYLLWKLVKAGKRVLFIYHPHTIYYDGHNGVFHCPEGPLPSSNELSFWSADLWCLFDAKEQGPSDLGRFPYEYCTFVLSTSPRREMINDFKKPPPPQIFYMPLWNEDELTTIATAFPGVNDWMERFRILGGIPRHVLEVTDHSPKALLEDACRQCELNDCIKIVGLDSTITGKSKVVHSLIHITSTSPFTKSSVSYASATALDIIIAKMGAEAKRKMQQLLESSAGNPLTASLCGYIFEPYALELLEKGGNFTCRKLVHGNTTNMPADTVLTIPPSSRMVVDEVELGQTLNQLYIPRTKNYTAIDAWIPGIGAFQMTVGKTHDIKGGAKDDLVLLGTNGNKLYWLLPPLYFKTFTKKHPQYIDQYAVKIPYPNVDE